ncbi:MAG: glycosyltransferase [Pseudonocardiaceae bacterium]
MLLLGPLAVASATAWAYLLVGHGSFWLTSARLPADPPEPDSWPSVGVIVPARDEAAVLPEALPTLLTQDYPGELAVWLVDDDSSDGTVGLAHTLAGQAGGRVLRTVAVAALPGWTGKLNAVQRGVQAASTAKVDFLLLTDADIAHHPSSVRRLVTAALADDRDLVSLIALLRTHTGWERTLVPAFVYFFAQLYPFPRVARPGGRTAAAAGGCVLIRRGALERAGGLTRIRGELIDDAALGRLLKRSGTRIWLGFTGDPPEVRSVRPYPAWPTCGTWSPAAPTPSCATHRSCSSARSPAWSCSTSSRPSPVSPGWPDAHQCRPPPGSARGPRWPARRRRYCGFTASRHCVGSRCLASRRSTPP